MNLSGQAGQFPTRFNALPLIPPGGPRYQVMDAFGGGGDRLALIDSRLQQTERTSRTLVDELMRVQSDMRMVLEKHERLFGEERSQRHQMENTMSQAGDHITQLQARLQRAEDRLQEERDKITHLTGQTKNVEQTVVTSQKELLNRKDGQQMKIVELKSQLEDMTHVKDRLEQTMIGMMDEVRTIKFKFDSQSVDMATVIQELKHKSAQNESDNRTLLEVIKKNTNQQDVSDYQGVQTKQQIESRLVEVRDALADVRRRVDAEAADRHNLEQNVGSKVTDLANNLAEQNRRREEAVRALESIQKDSLHQTEIEKQRLQSKVGEIAEEVSKKILANDSRIREELQLKFHNMEKNIELEHTDRLSREKDLREEADKKVQTLKKIHEEEFRTLRDAMKADRQKYGGSLLKLDEAVNLLDRHLDNTRKQVDKILAAEITARKVADKELSDRVNGLDHKVLCLQQNLQESIQGLSNQMETIEHQMSTQIKKAMSEVSDTFSRALADVDKRVTVVSQQLPHLEQDLKHQMAEIKQLSKAMKELESELTEQIKSEETARCDDVTSLKRLLDELAGLDGNTDNDPDVKIALRKLGREMADVQEEVDKMSKGVTTVKNMIGIRVSDEMAMRSSDVVNVHEELDKLRAALKKLAEKLPPSTVRPPLQTAPRDVNKWHMFNVYRWLMTKRKMMAWYERAMLSAQLGGRIVKRSARDPVEESAVPEPDAV